MLTQLIGPRGKTQWSRSRRLLGDFDPTSRRPYISLRFESFDDIVDLGYRHAIGGVRSYTVCHGSGVTVDCAVAPEIQVLVEQLSINSLKRKPPFSSVAADSQH